MTSSENNQPADATSSELKDKTTQATTLAEPAVGSEAGAELPSIVGIGASAGGLEALEELVAAMPADTGLAFVIILHQHRGYKSLLSDLLGRKTSMPVIEVKDRVRLQHNHVYICPPGEYLAALNGTLQITHTADDNREQLPIDYFLKSLAQDRSERAIGIILSGTGTDGSLGLKAVKAACGMVMVQDPQTAKYAGMPASAIATGEVDYILAAGKMPAQLVAYISGPYHSSRANEAASGTISKEPLQEIFILLRDRTGNDFSSYKTNTIGRRIERRMNLHQIATHEDYVRYLQDNLAEIDSLFRELLINVTDFFRDADAWKVLATELDSLVMKHDTETPLRAWVPGCATGEEAFSLAIALCESMRRTQRKHDVQIFATDLDESSIALARVGQYPRGIAAELPADILSRYFNAHEDTYSINNAVREMVVFAPHNLIKDPPFTRLDILLCRTLLIYLNADLQKRLIPFFHYALKPDGLLFLGSSETIGSFGELFSPLDARWKIFRRSNNATQMQQLPQWPRLAAYPTVNKAVPSVSSRKTPAVSIVSLIERRLLERFAPSCVVVNARGDIFYFHGHTGAYLEPSQGEPRSNVLEMARDGLKMAVASALRECAKKEVDVQRAGLAVKTNGMSNYVDLTVSSLQQPDALRGLFLIDIKPARRGIDETVAGDSDNTAVRHAPAPRVTQLERELEYLHQSYQTIVEEMETSAEELKSSNEELQSTNEELQSTNEELETSKEEMQSLNEELTTVNAELQSKLEELSRANDDMLNLLNSTDIATIFLDRDLRIQRYTEQVRELVMVRPGDIGRPISELAVNLAIDDLASDCASVLKTLVFSECEVEKRDDGKTSYLLRIMPYRTANNVIDGVVLTFVNVAKLKQEEPSETFNSEYFASIVDTVRQPLLVLNEELRVLSANKSFYRSFNTTPRQTENALLLELHDGKWKSSHLELQLQNLLTKNESFEGHAFNIDVPMLGQRSFVLNGRRLEQRSGADIKILLAMEEIPPAAVEGINP